MPLRAAPLAIALALTASCGGSDKPVRAAAATAAPTGPTNQPGEGADRQSLCQRAVDHAIEVMQREGADTTDPKELEASRAQGVKDCVVSPATTEEIDCVIRAQSVADLAACGR
jgi:hypothetical protein